MASVPTIRRALRADLPEAATLLAATLRFPPHDAVPAWLMRTTDECGGLTLVAVDGDAVIGVSYALPAHRAGEPYLFSCGLAVAPGHRGQRLGLALKREQAGQAQQLGYSTIRWTADPVNGRALRVYLSGLGARIVSYRPGLHDSLRANAQDDVDIVWSPCGGPALDTRRPRRVELPWAEATPADRDRVRAAMTALLQERYVGWGADLDRASQRCWICFSRPL